MKAEKNKVSDKKKIIIAVIIILVVVIGVYFGIGKLSHSESDTVRLGFKDIGELATQSVYSKEVSTTEDARTLFGYNIPFTESKCIFSYGVEIKAGYDFADIKWSVNETAKVIKVELPEVKILDVKVDMDSFQLYHEDESIFTNISSEDMNESAVKLADNAKKSAIKHGLYDKARENAETLIKTFIGQSYDLKEYEVKVAK